MPPLAFIWLMFACLIVTSCSEQPALDLPHEEPSLTLSIVIQESDTYTGWLYSYGMEWVLCEEESAWYWPGIIPSAHASHPITYNETGEWSWHQRMLIGEEQEFIFQGPLGNHRYCGLHWLFAHGGITADGILSSFQIEQSGVVVATSHHAWALNLEFDEPLCGAYPGQTVEAVIPTELWLTQTMNESSPILNTREGTLRLVDFVSVQSPSCP